MADLAYVFSGVRRFRLLRDKDIDVLNEADAAEERHQVPRRDIVGVSGLEFLNGGHGDAGPVGKFLLRVPQIEAISFETLPQEGNDFAVR